MFCLHHDNLFIAGRIFLESLFVPLTKSAGATEFTQWISAEGQDFPQRV